MVGDEFKRPPLRFFTKITKDGAGLGMGILEHFVESPTPKESDDISVNSAAVEIVSSSRFETTGGNIGRRKP